MLIIAFNIGSELNLKNLGKLGKALISIVIWERLGAYLLILAAMLMLHQSLPLSLLIAAVGCATAPALTVLVLNEYQAQGRISGKIIGASLGAVISKAPPVLRKYTGLGLFSQAGIAIGLCMVPAKEFPAVGDTTVAIALGTTIVTEIIGPLSTKYAISKAGEIGKKKVQSKEI